MKPHADFDEAILHLRAGDWEKAHAIVQDDLSDFGCWAHGIVHVLEGDMSNAGYWYRRANRPFPADPKAEIESLAAAWEARS